MFSILTNKFVKIFNKLSRKGTLTESNIKEALREIRITLLEADVTLSVVQDFINFVSKKSIGNNVSTSFTPGQELIKIVKKELISILGENNSSLNLSNKIPTIIMLVGLQGQGKTTSIAKLGSFIKNNNNKKILAVSADTYRPAAIKQLEILSKQAKIDFYPSNMNEDPIKIVRSALQFSKLKLYDVLLVDTAGRLHVNQTMMHEIIQINKTIKPTETLLVIDAMIGQDATNIAHTFNKSLPITGFIITKTDSDCRAGIIFSMKYITKKPIKFISTGEKLNEFEIFYPNRIVTRILGMGDVLSLIENIENKISKKNIKQLTNSVKNQDKFNYNDLLIQIKQIKKIGNISSILKKLPRNQKTFEHIHNNINEKLLSQMETMIYSMTPEEKYKPELIKGSRKRRISKGSGLSIQTINLLIKQFNNIKKIMKNIKKNGINKIMKKISNIMY
ncbi:MAG: signal recognition particle protein [Buchnera aphidicola (Nurudea shiraii)]